MKISTLVENTTISPCYKARHGLCLYIETPKHKLLFDLGPNELFLEHAKALNINISSIDTVIISHGHKDHGGALAAFLTHNQTAKVYIQEAAFLPYYTKCLGLPFYVGLDSALAHHPQVTLDDFTHEQSLIIKENEAYTLIGGCAHRGIINIQHQAEEIIGTPLTHVISGFHLYNPVSRKKESNQLVEAVGDYLKCSPAKYYTCHCIGKKAFHILQNRMGKQIDYLSTGCSLYI